MYLFWSIRASDSIAPTPMIPAWNHCAVPLLAPLNTLPWPMTSPLNFLTVYLRFIGNWIGVRPQTPRMIHSFATSLCHTNINNPLGYAPPWTSSCSYHRLWGGSSLSFHTTGGDYLIIITGTAPCCLGGGIWPRAMPRSVSPIKSDSTPGHLPCPSASV